MINRSIIVALLSFVFLIGLVLWQIKELETSQKLIADLDKQEMQSILLKSAIEIRKAEERDPTLKALDKLTIKTEEVLQHNFAKYNRSFTWGAFIGLGDSIYGPQSDTLIGSSIKTCLSCLILIGLLDEDGNISEDRGFVLDQTPAQMRNIRGLELKDMKYLYLFPQDKAFSYRPYFLPLLLILGLSCLIFWLLYLNAKQQRLITQKNEFVNHLSHQFQTPLSSIKLSANLLADQKSRNAHELIKIIQTESNRLERHIKTVLSWVKSDADRLHINKTSVSITDIIEQSIKQLKPVFISNGTSVNFIPPEKEIIINGDTNHIQLMLFNLWENAMKHNDKQIRILITCRILDNYLQISTEDNGLGLVNNVNDTKWKGLGLEYVSRIMEEHKGSIALHSQANKGLTVHLNFPIND
ncbi:MAG: HAMP domain-containing histidine kinase [Bacteroidetes bacterium]|nr:HAMP domain-containing histidine kinase [Bacteroidota bacterium]